MTYQFKLVKESEREYASMKYIFEKIGFKGSIIRRTVLGYIKNEDETVSIEVKNERINLKDCEKVSLYFEGYEGQLQLFLIQFRLFLKISFGDRNRIVIQTEKKTLEYKVWLESKRDRNNFKKLLQWCYDNGIQIKEFYRGVRTFKWKRVDYHKIQSIKEKYNLKEW
ncbi:MAG: hypothetical protein AAF985_17545 [Bacteroidota bacterium]